MDGYAPLHGLCGGVFVCQNSGILPKNIPEIQTEDQKML
jgi:hypothetical protein